MCWSATADVIIGTGVVAVGAVAVALVIGAVVAGIVDLLAFASMWCAFAAVVSVLVVRRTRHASAHLLPSFV